MHHRIRLLLTCLFALPTATQASIELSFQSVQKSTTATLEYHGKTIRSRVGQMIFQAQNETGTPDLIPSEEPASLQAFCIELGQSVSSRPKTYQKANVADAPDPYISGEPKTYKIGAERAAALDLLADNFWDDATDAEAESEEAVAFQLSVWEIVHEDLPALLPSGLAGPLDLADVLDVTVGSFKVGSGGSDVLADAKDLANSWLQEVSDWFDADGPSASNTLVSNSNLALIALTSNSNQDQITQYHNPEPVSLIVWGGLLSVGLSVSARRRS